MNTPFEKLVLRGLVLIARMIAQLPNSNSNTDPGIGDDLVAWYFDVENWEE